MIYEALGLIVQDTPEARHVKNIFGYLSYIFPWVGYNKEILLFMGKVDFLGLPFIEVFSNF